MMDPTDRPNQDLASSEDRYRRLFEDDVTGRLVATPEWQLIEINPALAQLLGSEGPALLIGRRLTEFSSDAAVLQKLVSITRAEGKAGPFEVSFDRLDGEVSHTAFSVVGTFDAVGELVALRGQLVEATESKRLQTRLTVPSR